MVLKRMIEGMDLGPEQGQNSKRIMDRELSWLDELVSDGRRFLVGEQFTRADLTPASLLAPLAAPKEHAIYAGLRPPREMEKELTNWKSRPSMAWVREIYGEHR